MSEISVGDRVKIDSDAVKWNTDLKGKVRDITEEWICVHVDRLDNVMYIEEEHLNIIEE